MAVNYFILKRLHYNNMERVIVKIYNNLRELAIREAQQVFWTSVLTSWITPCTVWTNNKQIYSNFLVNSAFFTSTINVFGIIIVYSVTLSIGPIYQINPPILHCFNQEELNSTKLENWNVSSFFL